MYWIKIVFIINFTLLLTCCNTDGNSSNKTNTTAEKDTTHILVLPNNISKNNKLVVFIDADCLKCVGTLVDWKAFITNYDLLSKNNLDFVFYVHTSNYPFFEHINNSKILFPVAFVNDSLNLFQTKNQLSDDMRQNAFLVNSNNEILARGNPLFSPDLLNRYIANIKSF